MDDSYMAVLSVASHRPVFDGKWASARALTKRRVRDIAHLACSRKKVVTPSTILESSSTFSFCLSLYVYLYITWIFAGKSLCQFLLFFRFDTLYSLSRFDCMHLSASLHRSSWPYVSPQEALVLFYQLFPKNLVCHNPGCCC